MKVSIKSFFHTIINQINLHADNANNPYKLFGMFGSIAYPLYYFILSSNDIGHQILYLRLIATCLCLLLALKDYWPKNLLHYYPLYWYLTLLYCLPLLFTFLLLKAHFSDEAVLNTISVLVLSILLVDTVALIIILPIGILLGSLSFKLTGSEIFIPSHINPMIISCLSILVCAALFAHKREISQNEKLKTMRSLASSLAHEIRTPLASIQANIVGVKNYWPDLLTTYNLAKTAKLPVPLIRSSQMTLLEKSFYRIQREVDFANLVVNMLLFNVDLGKLNHTALEPCSMADCIHEALDRYPFADSERTLVEWKSEQNFMFNGKKILLVHVLFNLLKNSLHHIKLANKGSIRIFLHSNQHENRLHFRDTGSGVATKILPHIFEPFFSKTRHGSGVGLPFCKAVIESFNGKIACESIEGEYTEFILSFPKI